MPKVLSAQSSKILMGVGLFVLGMGAGVALRSIHLTSDPAAVGMPAPTIPSLQPVLRQESIFLEGSGKIAIVLDDWGYSRRHVSWLASVQWPLTIAVLPGLPYSSRVAEAAHTHGHEVILHMPMEAMNPAAARESRTILTGMSRQEILDRLSQSLASVPYARGISNHQGSKVTADSELMEVILRQTQRNNLYFLDNRTGRSVAARVAKQLGTPFAERAVFLDHKNEQEAIRQQLVQLTKLAAERGQAIGIGHDRPETLEVLEEILPALERAGYTLVLVSELVERSQKNQQAMQRP